MKMISAVIVSSFMLAACIDSSSDDNNAGDTGSSETPELSGQFKDNSTEGLDYSIGDYHGKTGAGGSFSYFTESDVITFSVGGVVLGSATVSDILTPIDLFSDGSSEKIDVQNIVSFLLALDSDGDASNGINISEDLAEQAKSWPQLDFSTDNFEDQVVNNISTDLDIPTSLEAKAHIESTYNCIYSGLWIGEYGGNDVDEGTFFSYVDSETGVASGAIYSDISPALKMTSERHPVSYTNEVLLVAGNSSAGSYFEVAFQNITSAAGYWRFNSSAPGTLSAQRFNQNLAYDNRITAKLTSSQTGYTNDSDYYVTIDLKDSGEFKAGIYAYNEEVSETEFQGETVEIVSKRIAEEFNESGTLNAGIAIIPLSGMSKSIKLTVDLTSGTNTISLLNDSDENLSSISGGSCKLI